MIAIIAACRSRRSPRGIASASAMARALGAGRIDEARLLVPQAVLLAVGAEAPRILLC